MSKMKLPEKPSISLSIEVSPWKDNDESLIDGECYETIITFYDEDDGTTIITAKNNNTTKEDAFNQAVTIARAAGFTEKGL